MNRERRALVAEAKRMGFAVTPTNGGHLRAIHPLGGIVIMASSPSDYRGSRNALARLRRVVRQHVSEEKEIRQ